MSEDGQDKKSMTWSEYEIDVAWTSYLEEEADKKRIIEEEMYNKQLWRLNNPELAAEQDAIEAAEKEIKQNEEELRLKRAHDEYILAQSEYHTSFIQWREDNPELAAAHDDAAREYERDQRDIRDSKSSARNPLSKSTYTNSS